MLKRPKRLTILGSTGSIGKSALEVVRALGPGMEIVGLSARARTGDLCLQIREFKPRMVAVVEDVDGGIEKVCRETGTGLLRGRGGLDELAAYDEADLVLNAIVGAAGIDPTLAAIRARKDVAIANKECLVAAGGPVIGEAKRAGVHLIPVDSEHSAVFQCMIGEDRKAVRRIILTASGGPLVDKDRDALERVTASEALRHPTWRMGPKVTVDSATLLNKGFEVIEAHWLFGLDADQIEVVIERKSIVHSLVEFVDGSLFALLSAPDMRLPIQYALTFPERQAAQFSKLDLLETGTIAFERPDLERFPCLALAYEALRLGGTAPAALSAADEVAVAAFLDGRIGLGDIYRILDGVLSAHPHGKLDSLEAVKEADGWARRAALEMIEAKIR